MSCSRTVTHINMKMKARFCYFWGAVNQEWINSTSPAKCLTFDTDRKQFSPYGSPNMWLTDYAFWLSTCFFFFIFPGWKLPPLPPHRLVLPSFSTLPACSKQEPPIILRHRHTQTHTLLKALGRERGSISPTWRDQCHLYNWQFPKHSLRTPEEIISPKIGMTFLKTVSWKTHLQVGQVKMSQNRNVTWLVILVLVRIMARNTNKMWQSPTTNVQSALT